MTPHSPPILLLLPHPPSCIPLLYPPLSFPHPFSPHSSTVSPLPYIYPYQMQLSAAELQRRTMLFDDDVAEYSARVKALEAAAVKMRAQIAEADAGSMLKDELLTAALSKQVIQPTLINHKPSIINHKPSTTNHHKPSTTNDQPPSTVRYDICHPLSPLHTHQPVFVLTIPPFN